MKDLVVMRTLGWMVGAFREITGSRNVRHFVPGTKKKRRVESSRDRFIWRAPISLTYFLLKMLLRSFRINFFGDQFSNKQKKANNFHYNRFATEDNKKLMGEIHLNFQGLGGEVGVGCTVDWTRWDWGCALATDCHGRMSTFQSGISTPPPPTPSFVIFTLDHFHRNRISLPLCTSGPMRLNVSSPMPRGIRVKTVLQIDIRQPRTSS